MMRERPDEDENRLELTQSKLNKIQDRESRRGNKTRRDKRNIYPSPAKPIHRNNQIIVISYKEENT